jgi:hypothetical protein
MAGAVAVALAVTGSPSAHADPYGKIILNGQDITGDHVGVSCGSGSSGANVTTGHIMGTTSKGTVAGQAGFEITADNQLVRLSISTPTNAEYGVLSSNAATHAGGTMQHGDATVTNSGLTYQIIGHVSPQKGGVYNPGDPAVPFEVDVTCNHR